MVLAAAVAEAALREMADATVDVAAAMRYARLRYGQDGQLPPGWAVARNDTGRSESVGGNGSGSGIVRFSNGVVHVQGGGGSTPGSTGGGGAAGGGAGGGGSAHVIGGGAGLVQWGPGGGSGTYATGGPVRRPEPESEPRIAAGSVTGYRWWTMMPPDFQKSPAHADLDWARGLLHGAQDAWQPGVNTAVCRPHYGQDGAHEAPAEGCYCGFWAYWQPLEYNLGAGVPVFGVVKGWGRFRRGPRGFRVGKARILAVHLKFTLAPRTDCLCGNDPRTLLRPNGAFTARPRSAVCTCPKPSPEEEAADIIRAEAWMAVMGDRLEQLYPGVRVFETRDALLAAFPPDPVYGKAAACPACGEADVYGRHAISCPRPSGR